MSKIKEAFTTLFVTRKYPPQIGGMQNFSYGLITNFPGKKIAVTYGGSQKWLLFIYPWLFFKSLFLSLTRNVDIIHLGDGVMTPLGYVLKIITRRKIVFTAHGKDINLKFKPYQAIMPYFFNKMDHIYCVSNNTVEECVKVGVARERCTFIPNGVDTNEFQLEGSVSKLKEELSKKYKVDFGDRKILITVGRLSKRKGVLWFVENVMPKLGKEYLYLSIGPDSTEVSDLKSWFGYKSISYGERLKKLIENLDLRDQIFWLGKLPFSDLKKFFNIADLFIMPNVPVPGDLEGFGIVAIEAGSVGLPVIASNIEGIKDAVIDGKTGFLVKSRDIEGFINAIKRGIDLFDSDKVKKETEKRYSWESISERYQKAFRDVLRR